MTKMSATPQPIIIQGINCGAAAESAHRALLMEADIISGGAAILHGLQRLPEYADRVLPLELPLADFVARLGAKAGSGKKIVVLADGDPLFFGIGATITRLLGRQMADIRPAVSSMQTACARHGLPWHNMACISLHGRDDLRPLFSALGRNVPICVLTGTRGGPDFVARFLLDRGHAAFTAHVFENLGSPGEKCRILSLPECGQTLFADCCILILEPRGNFDSLRPGINGSLLAGDYTTQKPARGAILEFMRIRPRDTVWDIGSGTGALALEFASQARDGAVVAVEEKYSRCLDIQLNRQKLGAANLGVCLGHAPDCLANLPHPDKIFIGGGLSGEDHAALLEKCASALPPCGVLAASCILLDSLQTARAFMADLGWPLECVQLHFSKMAPLGKGEYLAPENPVFVLAATKPL